MSLRIKLVITYVIMLIISVVIIVFAGVGLITGAIADTAKAFIGDQTGEQAFNRAVDIVVDLRYTEKYNPEMLAQDSFAAQIAEQVDAFGGFLVVKSSGKFMAFGTDQFDESLYSLVEAASEFSGSRSHGFNFAKRNVIWNKEEYTVLKHDFNSASSVVSYYFLVRIKDADEVMERYNGAMVFVLLLLTAVIIGPLLYITTKDIVNPLRKLENSAQEIARGNLDFQLQSKSNNEIGSVIRSYEKMRCELKKSITRQLEMEENRKQLLSNITHDLKTPITSIKGYVQGIRDGVANDPAKLSRYLDVIYSKTEDMNAMIDDLFLFSKLDLGKEPFNKDDVELGEFYGNCVQELRLELDGRGVALAAEYHASEGRKVFMDSQKIKRVILNIVGNSLKFMDKDQKRLNLTFAEDSGNLVIKIRDNGIGIAREELDKIFDRFYRTDPSRNRNTGGSGLGLAIAWQIVEQHNGTIKAESEKGEWTEIAFSIPLNR